MLKKTIVGNFVLLLISGLASAQETQMGPPAQPTSSVYNRMRRVPAPEQSQAAQPQQAARQFPVPGRQFPPDQHATTVPQTSQGTPSRSVPPGVKTSVPQTVPQQAPSASQPQPAQQSQAPYGLALQPPNPPRISYANGELTVIANNSSLADIVSGVERAIGARLEGTRPDSERVFGQFGPATPREVLNSLFSGSKYDFILAGGLDDPGAVKSIILSPHGTTPAVNTAANQPRPAQNEDEENDTASQNEQPTEVPSPQPEPPPPPASGQQQQQQVKTPEQLLQELQRLRQQQQSQQPQPPTPR